MVQSCASVSEPCTREERKLHAYNPAELTRRYSPSREVATCRDKPPPRSASIRSLNDERDRAHAHTRSPCGSRACCVEYGTFFREAAAPATLPKSVRIAMFTSEDILGVQRGRCKHTDCECSECSEFMRENPPRVRRLRSGHSSRMAYLVTVPTHLPFMGDWNIWVRTAVKASDHWFTLTV